MLASADMRIAYSVTFEFETRAPLTHRGVVEAGSNRVNVSLSLRRAGAQAYKAIQPRQWVSAVAVLDKAAFGDPKLVAAVKG